MTATVINNARVDGFVQYVNEETMSLMLEWFYLYATEGKTLEEVTKLWNDWCDAEIALTQCENMRPALSQVASRFFILQGDFVKDGMMLFGSRYHGEAFCKMLQVKLKNLIDNWEEK